MLVHGPGAVSGQKIRLTWEQLAFLAWAYRLDEHGRRCFDRVVLSRGKGWAKSEFAAWVTLAEALAPCRFAGWHPETGAPTGKTIRDPWIRLMATEEGQTANTFDAVRDSLLDGPAGEHYGLRDRADVQQDRVVIPTGGTIQATTASARAKDGGRETFGVADEIHLFILRALISMVETVARNMAKRVDAEPWMLFTTTAYALGEESFAERMWDRAAKLSKTAPVADLEGRFLFDHREGGPLTAEEIAGDRDLVMVELAKAYGDATWMISDRVVAELREGSLADANRYFLNAVVPGNEAWLNMRHVEAVQTVDRLKKGDVVCLGFDGSRADDATALVAVRVSDGLMELIDVWQKPPDDDDWKMPGLEIEAALEEAFERFNVLRFYGDPPYWQNELDRLAQKHGKHVYEWHTSSRTKMAEALERFRVAIETRQARLSENQILRSHLGNAVRVPVPAGYGIRKPKPTVKIDCAVAATLAWEARGDAIAGGDEHTDYEQAGSWN